MKKLLAAIAASLPLLANAGAFEVGTVLLGDPRNDNPNGIELTVYGSIVDDTGTFTVTLTGAAHPDALLDEFYFNLLPPANQYVAAVTNPASWSISTPASVVGGGNNTGFLFEASGPNADRPGYLESLEFVLSKTTGDFTTDDFNLAAVWESNNLRLGGGQLGAHIQSLDASLCTTGFQCSDSGFVRGDWTTVSVASPGMAALLGLGLTALGWSRRKA